MEVEMGARIPLRSRLFPVLAAALLLLSAASTSLAASANAEPETQSHSFSVSSHWQLTWGGDNPFDYNFHYGDGVVRVRTGTNAVAESVSHKFFPCTTTTFTQWFRVWDSDSGYAQDYTTARETGGVPC
jgi:hypothetical protein